jgi:hypothetical protein
VSQCGSDGPLRGSFPPLTTWQTEVTLCYYRRNFRMLLNFPPFNDDNRNRKLRLTLGWPV